MSKVSEMIKTLNQCNKENSVAKDQGRQLYLFMLEKGYNYCLYRIGDPPADSSDEASVRGFDKPLLTMDKHMYPEIPAFTAIGTRIFMIGGFSNRCSSNRVFIYDTLSSTLAPGPDMNSGKDYPYLFIFGSKIFALSRRMYVSEEGLESNPRFEMLDTSDHESKWSPLPNPMLHVSNNQTSYTPCGAAAVHVNGSPVIFVSVESAGTYCFEVDNLVWNYIGTELLPIDGNAVSNPHLPSICFGHSLKSERFAAFRFCYEGNGKGFKVNEIMVYGYENLPSLGGPPLMLERSLPVVFGPDNRVYFIVSGVDKPETSWSPPGNRYVKVYALDFEGINLDLNEPRSFKKQKLIGPGEDKDETTKFVELMDLDEEQDETVEVALNKGQSSKSWKGNNEEQNETTECGNEKMEIEVEEETKEYLELVELSSIWGDREWFPGSLAVDETCEGQNETTEVNLSKVPSLTKCGNEKREMEVEEETKESLKLGLSCIWGECFSGGPAVRETMHVIGAIAM